MLSTRAVRKQVEKLVFQGAHGDPGHDGQFAVGGEADQIAGCHGGIINHHASGLGSGACGLGGCVIEGEELATLTRPGTSSSNAIRPVLTEAPLISVALELSRAAHVPGLPKPNINQLPGSD